MFSTYGAPPFWYTVWMSSYRPTALRVLRLRFGYYADPVDETTATLPKGWKGRLVNLPAGDTEGVRGLCLVPHDLAIAKYVARREKDLTFTRELARRGIVSQERLLSLLDQTPVDEEARDRIRTYIATDFSARRTLLPQ
jgi:hypothetical protein